MNALRTFFLLAVAAAGALASLAFPMSSNRIWVDSVTGSMKSQTTWLLLPSPPREAPMHEVLGSDRTIGSSIP